MNLNKFKRITAAVLVVAMLLLSVASFAEGMYNMPIKTASAASSPTSCLPGGDVDGDGETTVADALLTMRDAMQLSQLGAHETIRADVDGDGTVSIKDALQICRAAMELITLPPTTENPDDGNDVPDTDVEASDQYVLSADKREVLADMYEIVTFYVNSTLTVPYFELYVDGIDTGVRLYDDGDLENHADDIPNDGCYTCTYIMDSDEERDIPFTAKATVGDTEITTGEYEIFSYYELTDEQIADMDEVDARIQDIIASTNEEYSDADEEVLIGQLHDGIMQYLTKEASTLVDEIYDDTEDYIISFRYISSNIFGATNYYDPNDYIEYTPDDGFFNGTSSFSDLNALDGNGETRGDNIYGPKALLLCYEPLVPGLDVGTLEDSVENLTGVLKKSGFNVDARYNVTVDDFLNMQNYDYVYIACHGSYCGYGLFNIKKTPVICTPQKATFDSNRKYSSDLKKHRIIKGNGKYWIRPDFFDFYYQADPLNAEIFQLGCCRGNDTGDNNGFAKPRGTDDCRTVCYGKADSSA